MSQANLALAANPAAAAAIIAAGGSLPNLAQAVALASEAEKNAIMKSATESAQVVLQAATALTISLINAKNALLKSLAETDAKLLEVKTDGEYFNDSNNIFPLRKLVGIPTSREILVQYPNIEKIPEDWVNPNTAPAVAAA